ncbi:hypothetical protein D8674_031499 [Pyrus ussuriensis x Pyrus communis]|uniref:Uncharacterized protein n=1 Tax=Pyrus ussuriensis x Pyrus communis TaxID=2448454 RepID=A0A5N5EYS3_9ROSA|nr:hypothetical protein D8674_031499 [Pyrus ussuriensis x Pyrus communis]
MDSLTALNSDKFVFDAKSGVFLQRDGRLKENTTDMLEGKNFRGENKMKISKSKRGFSNSPREVSGLIFTSENKDSGYVNIKLSETNLYLTGALKEGVWWSIVATAHTPNENMNDEYCTLFKPEKVGQGTFRISHAYTQSYLRPCDVAGLEAVLCAINSRANPLVDLFTITRS